MKQAVELLNISEKVKDTYQHQTNAVKSNVEPCSSESPHCTELAPNTTASPQYNRHDCNRFTRNAILVIFDLFEKYWNEKEKTKVGAHRCLITVR